MYTHVDICIYIYICVCVFHEYSNTLNLRCLQIMIENQFIIFKTDKNKEKELDIYLNFLI